MCSVVSLYFSLIRFTVSIFKTPSSTFYQNKLILKLKFRFTDSYLDIFVMYSYIFKKILRNSYRHHQIHSRVSRTFYRSTRTLRRKYISITSKFLRLRTYVFSSWHSRFHAFAYSSKCLFKLFYD